MRRVTTMHLPRRQRGLALLVLLVLFAMAASYMLVDSLNRGGNSLALARAEQNRAVLQQARAALLAWSASATTQGGTFQPGALPCPDRNNDGVAEATCSSANRIGRLPYKTLGIAPLYDASGELLWYGLSSAFRRLSTNIINSDTQGTLTLSITEGTLTATSPRAVSVSNLVAVVLAPGVRLSTQNRGWTGASCSLTTDPCNTAANYLEDLNGDTTTTDYITANEKLIISSGDPSGTILFNDQLLAISQADLMSVIEPAVAAQISQDVIAQYIYNSTDTSTSTQWSDVAGPNKSRYFDAWGGFPFAATFANPGSSTFTGTVGTREGLLPVVDTLSYYWTGGSGSVVKTGGSGSISSSCSTPGSPNTIMRCVITSSGSSGVQPSFRMSGTVASVGRSLVQLPRLSDVSTSGGSITGTRSLSGSLNSAGAGIVMLDATMPWSWSGTTITVDINNDNLIASPAISTSDPYAGWFNSNEWYKQTYYAVSAGYAPGGSGSCTPGGTCLTVNNLTSATSNDKRAILILAGRSLAGVTRPNATLSDYLEAQNASTGDQVFEHGLRNVSDSGASINDKVVVVAP